MAAGRPPVIPFDENSPDPRRDREVAATLMRMALALLDRSGDPTLAGPRLQHALDSLAPTTGVTGVEGDENSAR